MDDSNAIDRLRARFLRLKGLIRNPKYSQEDKDKIQKEIDEVDIQILKLSQQEKKI